MKLIRSVLLFYAILQFVIGDMIPCPYGMEGVHPNCFGESVVYDKNLVPCIHACAYPCDKTNGQYLFLLLLSKMFDF